MSQELNEYIISHLTSLKVSTVGRMQKYVSDESAGSWSWYDLAVLDRRDATEPKIVEKKPLVWLANELPFEARDRDVQQTSGVFDRAHEIFEYLKVECRQNHCLTCCISLLGPVAGRLSRYPSLCSLRWLG